MKRKLILFGVFFGGIAMQYAIGGWPAAVGTALGIIIPATIVTYIERRQRYN